MLFLDDHVSDFLHRNRKYKVLGLFILLIVGVVLLGECGHLAHLKRFGFAVVPMSTATLCFSIAVLVAVDLVQSGNQKKLALERADNAWPAVEQRRRSTPRVTPVCGILADLPGRCGACVRAERDVSSHVAFFNRPPARPDRALRLRQTRRTPTDRY